MAAFPPTISSYGAELRAGLLAVKLLIDILKVLNHVQPLPPEVLLLHDSTTIGNQLIGAWHARADVPAASLLRHLAIYSELRFRICLRTRYVAAHRGEPGNELVDRLAGIAAHDQPHLPSEEWFSQVLSPSFGQAAAWFWTIFSPQFTDWWQGTHLCLPGAANTMPPSDILPSFDANDPTSMSSVVDLTIGTGNVLTLNHMMIFKNDEK